MPELYVDVIIPLAVKETYTYRVPDNLQSKMAFGIRVEVAFGKKKLYAGLVVHIHNKKPSYSTRNLLSLIDEQPVITREQYQLWQWIAGYYLCDLGEVMFAAMPARLKLQSETLITPGSQLDNKIFDLTDQEYLITEAVSLQKELTIGQIRNILDIKTVYPIIKKLLDQGVIEAREELEEDYRPRTITVLRLTETYREAWLSDSRELFEMVKGSDPQTRTLLAIWQLQQQKKAVSQTEVIKIASVSHAVISALIKKGILEKYETDPAELHANEVNQAAGPLTPKQKAILDEITRYPTPVKPVVLHGVTGSGKTRIYIELILKNLSAGKQVLYLLPEIALTTQLVHRLRIVLGENLLVYHSRIPERQRVEVWRKMQGFPKVILAARSGILLPFSDLGLIIVDEEHDPSYKQEDPNPRYQARDSAIVLAGIHQSMIILGSATPSIESLWNGKSGKYHYLELQERFGEMDLPEVHLVDMRKGAATGHLSQELVQAMIQMKHEGFQTILFQNRRGYAPLLMCPVCGWNANCKNCDTSLTYHQYSNQMICHLCGFRENTAVVCPACGNYELILKGFGTEMIEDEVKIVAPDLKVARLDLDTARGKNAIEKIIYQFEQQEIDVLVGTQMITKGLDFDRVGLVGIISADHLLHYPDFRASERAFQLITQVAGRAGRKHRRGRVLIQALHMTHPVLAEVLHGNMEGFYKREIEERNLYGFPPFSRMVILTIKHHEKLRSEAAAIQISQYLGQRLGSRVHGPILPSVPRVRNQYLHLIVLKLEKKSILLSQCKGWLKEIVMLLKKQKGFSTVRVTVNVDP